MIGIVITVALFITWLVLVALGKGGFVHLLLIATVCVGMTQVLAVFRSRMTGSGTDKP